MSKGENTKMEKIISLCKRRGFIFPASEIYDGISGFWDYGPLGVELSRSIKDAWWQKMVREHDSIHGVDGAIIQNPRLWKASGHIAGFTDPLVDCKKCGARHRADHLAGVESTDLEELSTLLSDKPCPTCGEKKLTKPRTYNMMMKTWVGPVEDDNSVAYLRPETAGSIFTNYKNVRETMREKLPFGIAQIGKAFRNEISPRDFIFRVRELEQMEMQYFIRPESQDEHYEYWREFAWNFLTDSLGIANEHLSWHEHGENERAHYAKAAHDIYFEYPQGPKELWGTHNRTDYDLSNHEKESGVDLHYFDEATKEKFIPNVIESSVGLGRLLLAVLADAYREEEGEKNTRVYLALKPEIAPVQVAVFPLLRNKPDLVEKAREIYQALRKDIPRVAWDDNGNIGKRYRRQDEIGTPFCVVFDFDSLEDECVSVRDRDSMEQQRVKIDELSEYFNEKLSE